MFFFTVKLTKWKLLAAVVVIAAILGVIIIAAGAKSKAAESVFASDISVKHIKTNEDRVNFLAQLGWEVDPQIADSQEAVIPKEFNDAYKMYNELQKTQGFDLEKYQGKKVKRYSYVVTNYPQADCEVRANLLMYKNTVIAGDICCDQLNGFMHGLVINAQSEG